MTAVQDPLEHISIIRVEGSLRAPVSTDLRHAVEVRLAQGERRFVISLAGVTDIDAAGAGELVRVYKMTIEAGGVLRVAHVSPRVRELLERIGLFELLDDDS